MEAFLEGEWESLSKMFSCEDSDLLLHFNGEREIPFNFSHPNENGANFLLPSNSNLDPNSFHSSSQESSHSHSHSHSSNDMESSHFTFFDRENRPNGGEFTHTFDDQAMEEFPTMDNKMANMIHDDFVGEILQLKAQMLCNDHMENGPKEIDDSCKEMQLKGSKKRPNACRERNKRNVQSKKAKKASENDEETSSTSEEETGTASESTGKAKRSKSPATDPQSLYARKRREKINERLRILQNLVPNGTKVDISTMLEEAVHYVKFLQLQIKLLSSEEMWMYAPIAYNGMDIGLYHKIVPSL